MANRATVRTTSAATARASACRAGAPRGLINPHYGVLRCA